MEKEKVEIRLRRVVGELRRIEKDERRLADEIRQIKQRLSCREEAERRLLRRRKARQERICEMLSPLRVPCVTFNGEHIDLWYDPNDGTGERRIDLVGFGRRNEMREIFARDLTLFVLFLVMQEFIPNEKRYILKWWDCSEEEWRYVLVHTWRNMRNRWFTVELS